jgi:hypothetical protein
MSFCFLFGEEHPRQIFLICASITTNSGTFRIFMHLPQLHFCQGNKKFKTSPTAHITSALLTRSTVVHCFVRSLGMHHRLLQ